VPSVIPSDIPSDVPSMIPSELPSMVPSDVPSVIPSDIPSDVPSMIPSELPSMVPSDVPSVIPSDIPSDVPSMIPSEVPSMVPSDVPSAIPSDIPSDVPSMIPSDLPSMVPSDAPSAIPFWLQLGLDIDGEATGDESGGSVSLSGDGITVAIGAKRNDGGGRNSGQVRVYHRVDSTWVKLGQDIDGEAASDQSGISVSLSFDGKTVAIGSKLNDGNGSNSGQVRVFHLVDSAWAKVGQDIDGEATDDESGVSVSLSGDGSIVAIGASKNDGNGNNSGHVRVFSLVDSVWGKLGQDIDGEAANDQSGVSVSFSDDGNSVAIGAKFNDGNGNKSGHVRVFHLVNSAWAKLGQDIDGEATDDESGVSVSLSGDGKTVAIGARYNDGNGDNSGQVRVYHRVDSAWVKLGQDIDGEATDDESGVSVSLSGDGSIVAIGASKSDGNGSNSGHVRVFHLVDSAWAKLGQDIDGEAAWNKSGASVSLSSDGSTIAIGASKNRGNGSKSGHVRVYHLLV